MREAGISPYKAAVNDADCGRSSAGTDARLPSIADAEAPLARYCQLRELVARDFATHSERREIVVLEEELRGKVAVIVSLLQAQSVPPERVLICLKELLNSVSNVEPDVSDAVRQRLTRWAIEDYFGTG
jgi:hypothetical protein